LLILNQQTSTAQVLKELFLHASPFKKREGLELSDPQTFNGS